MERKQRVLILTGPWGHLSLAEAIKGMCRRRGWETQTVGLPEKGKLNLYKPFYLYFPSLFKLPFRVTQLKRIKKMVKQSGKSYLGLVERGVDNFRPQVIITTHFLFHYAVEEIIEKDKNIQFFNLVCNPWTIHPLEYSSEAINLTYDQKGVKFAKRIGLGETTTVPVGWVIRDQFYRSWPKVETRKKLGLKPKTLTVLICGGSEGNNTILRIFPAIMRSPKSLQVIIVAGKNVVLYNLAKSVEKLFNSGILVWESRVSVKVFRFVKNMAPLILASDLVIGKAGPNLLFETVACRRPFFAISHIHGQEDGNLDIIRRKKLGWVEEDGPKAVRLLLKIINQPAIIDQLKNTIAEERKYNLSAEKKISKLLGRNIRRHQALNLTELPRDSGRGISWSG